MPKVGEKTASNVFYQARIKASSHNEALSSREGAADRKGAMAHDKDLSIVNLRGEENNPGGAVSGDRDSA